MGLVNLPNELILNIAEHLPAREIANTRLVCKHIDQVIKTNERAIIAPKQNTIIFKLQKDVDDYLGRGDGDLLNQMLHFFRHRGLSLDHLRKKCKPFGDTAALELELEQFATQWLWHHTSQHWTLQLPPMREPWFEESSKAIAGLASTLLDHYMMVYDPEQVEKMRHPHTTSLWMLPGLQETIDRDGHIFEHYGITQKTVEKWYHDIRHKLVLALPEEVIFDGAREPTEFSLYNKANPRVVPTLNRVLGLPMLPHVAASYCVMSAWAQEEVWEILAAGVEELEELEKLAVLEEIRLC